MTVQELADELKGHGIDLHKDRYDLGIDCIDCGDRFTYTALGYLHIVKGDRDNGRIVKIYDSEEEFVYDMLLHMYMYTTSNERRHEAIAQIFLPLRSQQKQKIVRETGYKTNIRKP